MSSLNVYFELDISKEEHCKGAEIEKEDCRKDIFEKKNLND